MCKLLITKRMLFLAVILSFIVGCGSDGYWPANATPTVKDTALEKIMAYAEDGTNAAPSLKDYIDAGVSGVSSENLAELNAVVDELELVDVDTTTEVIALTTELNINIGTRAKWGFKWDDSSVWQ